MCELGKRIRATYRQINANFRAIIEFDWLRAALAVDGHERLVMDRRQDVRGLFRRFLLVFRHCEWTTEKPSRQRFQANSADQLVFRWNRESLVDYRIETQLSVADVICAFLA